MSLAIFSDVHGNLPALDAVLTDIKARRLDTVYCLGDLVGYGPFPNEVSDRIQVEAIPTIMGNYDDGVGFDREECGCAYRGARERELGQRSFDWTKAHVTSANKAFLRTLASQLRIAADGTRILLVHGSPRKMNEYLFEDRPESSLQRIARSSNADMIIFGHTHQPYTKVVEGVRFVNVGSVGKPQDGDWRACYAIIEPTAADPVTFARVSYDLHGVIDAIQQAELPDEFASDLEHGGRHSTTEN